ncbi:transmembrane protein 230-like [Gigantopelta aegis]|uniref:transmembrane protein 230-like n=1 Tax=Gigantopelta aegis TaxID=1735272 RepID=UPI001B88D023|nr:transmembrane protein 230-like [Gigantopelta aegis]XP_041368288.1 transmembrane protein 230-like [Gigantopelta aegis]XP_041368289.1 transmembrane protein 230-like [Gigantopelta aegis]
MSKRAVSSMTDGARYHKLTKADDGYIDLQFQKPPPKVPYKAILLATVLFVGGSVLIIIGALLLTGYIDAQYSDRTWPVLLIGGVMFIPGFYHVRIAYYAYKGYTGYSYDDIPEFE